MRHLMIALSALTLGVGASAAEPAGMVVKYDDLDLASAKGQKTLKQRIDRAARDFCQDGTINVGSRIKPAAEDQCVSNMRAAAHQQMAVVIENQPLKGG